jgi:hypothetical protein
MRKPIATSKLSVGLAAFCVALVACGENALHGTPDAAADHGAKAEDLPAADTVPQGNEDLPTTRPDLPASTDLAPSEPGPDLPLPGDAPGDPVANLDGSDDRRVDMNLLDTRKRDVLSPAEEGPDRAPQVDLPPGIDGPPAERSYDLGGPDELVRMPDAAVGVDGPAADLCTTSGGTVSTQLCCSSAADFRDTCTTAVGACGCAPSSSVVVSVCTCPNGGCYLPGYGCVGPAGACTTGADQTCNPSEMYSSIHGRCVEGGRCLCTTWALSAATGRCQ